MKNIQEMTLEELKVRREELLTDVSRYNNMQLGKKVELNSAFGAFGNEWFRFFDIRIAESITLSGKLSIRWIEKKVNDYMNKILGIEGGQFIIASDTDSIYVDFNGVVEKYLKGQSKEKTVDFLDKISKEKIEPYIAKCYDELAERLNSYEQKMVMKREAIADKGIWTAKKHYILNVYDNEGVRYSAPKIKVTGIETVKSSTPAVCREALKKAIDIIMNEGETAVQKYIAEFREEFKTFPFESIAFPRSVSDVEKYQVKSKGFDLPKGCPINVRAAIVYNEMLRKHGLERQFEVIKNGEKIKFCYLKIPNPTTHDIIGSISVLPKQFDLEKYIDYETQFEKAFLAPLKGILDSIGWNPEKVNTVESFFE